MLDRPITIGITQGDINGIGYEILIKTFQDSRIFDICTPVIYGSPKVAAYHRKALNVVNFSFHSINAIEEAQEKKANLLNVLDDNVRVELGKATQHAGEAAIISLERATADLVAGRLDALVTLPLNNETTRDITPAFKGHTRYLMEQTKAKDSMLLITSEIMKVGILTGHIPVAEVPAQITVDNIIKKLRLLQRTLQVDFCIRKPRIAVLGLNPHAGNSGAIGKEETEVIIPAIEKANNEGIMALGPFSADGFFGSDSFVKFDAILAMYHDQGLAPFKALTFNSGVNYTAGLPIIRTTPDHGTAYELAGLDQANENSFRQAIYMAYDIFNNRQLHDEITANPLPTYEIND